jgi:hypothetical protein
VLNQTINSLATTCASGCKVKTLYDQSGASKCSAAACDLVQATNATRPTVTTSCQNSKICIVFNGTACMATANTVTTQAQPYTVSAVWTTTTAAPNAVVWAAFNAVDVWTGGSGGGGNIIASNAGSDANVTATDNVQHAAQFLYNTTTSSTYLDGTANTGLNTNTGSISGGPMSIGQFETCAGTFPWTGKWFEVGIWASNKTANNSTMNSNQHTYWNF